MLSQKIQEDLLAAMKAGDATRTSVLRMLKSELDYKHIDVQRELTDEDVLAVIGKEVKKRKEAVESFTAGGRSEQADAEAGEMALLQAYLPRQLTEEEIKAELSGMQLPADFPGAMKIVSPAFKGRADGGTVARLVKAQLGL